MERRDEFLLEMYRQMFNDINRNLTVVWQSIGVVIGAFAIFALVEKSIMPLDLACTIVVLLCAWLLAHVIDSGYWYNRNLAIIANIERQFLSKDDLRNIHYYFGSHRKSNKMITQLRVQVLLGVGMTAVVLIYHFLSRIVDGFSAPFTSLEPIRALPYVTAIATGMYCLYLVEQRRRGYEEFISNSPGIPIDASAITYGVGHGFGPTLLDGIRRMVGKPPR